MLAVEKPLKQSKRNGVQISIVKSAVKVARTATPVDSHQTLSAVTAGVKDVREVFDMQLPGKVDFPEALLVRQIEVNLVVLIVEIPQQIHDGFLNSADVQVVLKECDPLHATSPFLS